jgi:hypothetical protein
LQVLYLQTITIHKEAPLSENRALTWSYGGGIQSIAIAVLIAQKRLPVPECTVIADTGREVGTTWEYLEQYVQPLLATVGARVEIAPHTLSNVGLTGKNGDLLMPLFTQTGKLRTYCSGEWKREVVLRYLRSKGYGPKNPVETWIGFSMDEIGRCSQGRTAWQSISWPLIDIDDHYGTRMRRYQCEQIIIDAGLPPGVRSACRDCPHRRNSEWRAVRERPEEWALACATDKEVREYDLSRGNTGVYLHRSLVPLEEANLDEPDSQQLELEGPTAECQSGMCWT